MPELRDVEIYRERLEARLVGHGFAASAWEARSSFEPTIRRYRLR